MEKYLLAIEALKTAKEELAKNGTLLSWELVAVNKMSTSIGQANNDISGRLVENLIGRTID